MDFYSIDQKNDSNISQSIQNLKLIHNLKTPENVNIDNEPDLIRYKKQIILKKNYRDDKINKNGSKNSILSQINFKISDYFFSVFSNKFNKRIFVTDYLQNVILDNLGVDNIIRRLNDIEKLKYLILSDESRVRFERIKCIQDLPHYKK